MSPPLYLMAMARRSCHPPPDRAAGAAGPVSLTRPDPATTGDAAPAGALTLPI
jgi:hypothetical protein